MGLTGTYLFSLIVFAALLTSCTLSAELIGEPAKLTVVFTSPEEKLYTQDLTRTVRWTGSLSGDLNLNRLKLIHYRVQLFQSASCQGSPIDTIESAEEFYDVNNLLHSATYSVMVTPVTTLGEFPATCSPDIIVDHVPPPTPALASPASSGLIGQHEINFIWSPVNDQDSGLHSEAPYTLELYEGENCTGIIIQKLNQKDTVFRAENLQDGKTYSLKVLSRDQAGNLSPQSCSPSLEVDTRIPQINLSDSTARTPDEVAKSTTISTEYGNLGPAQYICLTEDLNFNPTGTTDACSGGGPQNGWHTTPPSQITLSPGDGPKNLHIWIADSDGSLITPHPGTASILLDTTFPGAFNVVGVGGSADSNFDSWLRTTLTPTIRWSDSVDTYEYSLLVQDASNNTVCPEVRIPAPASEKELTGCLLEDQKNYKVIMTSIDVAGNATSTAPFSFTTNNIPPDLFQILGLRGGADIITDDWLGTSDPVISWNLSNRADLYKLQILNGQDQDICVPQTISAPDTSFDYQGSPGACQPFDDGGAYKIVMAAEDFAGNRTNAENIPFLFRVDKSAPAVSIQNVPSTYSSQTAVTFTISALDALSGVNLIQCRLDSGAYQSCENTMAYSGLSQGAHSFFLRAVDLVGNVNTEAHTWTVDTSTPSVTLTSAPPASHNSNSGQFTFTYTDTYSPLRAFDCSLDGSPQDPCFSPFSYTALAEGSHTFTVRATDDAGNVSSQVSHSWVVDMTAPTVSITSTPSNPSHSDFNAHFSFTVTDSGTGLASVQCQLNSGPWEDCSNSKSYSGLSVGHHTFRVLGTDNAGNTAQENYSWTIYSYSWTTLAWGACSATQPSWNVGSWSTCSAAQPAYQYGSWGSCSVSCGGGTQSRTQTCPVANGTQTRTVTCPTTSGAQTRTVTCQRNDGTPVTDSYCLTAKPATSQSCSRNDCPTPAPANSQACSRGGGADCHSPQATSQACNTQACCTAANNSSNMCAGYTYCGACGAAAGTCASGSSNSIALCSDCPIVTRCQCN
ncbi:Ig-like domain-containing protein [Bdellovibrio sp.]|uniref:Ig-like domain-containing protein n=1 Tax=Bdellovibrio sp. TaxID=28201 RepID=UPI003221CC11